MDKRSKNRLRDRASKKLIEAGQLDAAKASWSRVWQDRHPMATKADVERARLSFLTAIDEGHQITEAESAARRILEREHA